MKEVTIGNRKTIIFNMYEVTKLVDVHSRTLKRWMDEGIVPESAFQLENGKMVFTAKQVLLLKKLMESVRKKRKRKTDPIPREYVLEYLTKREFSTAI